MLRAKPGSDSLSFPVSHILGFPLLYTVAQVGQTLRFSTFYRGFIQIPTQPLALPVPQPCIIPYQLPSVYNLDKVPCNKDTEKRERKREGQNGCFSQKKGKDGQNVCFSQGNRNRMWPNSLAKSLRICRCTPIYKEKG